jgi:hypothetical protein
MKIRWTRKASSDLVRLHDHLSSVAPRAAAHGPAGGRLVWTLHATPLQAWGILEHRGDTVVPWPCPYTSSVNGYKDRRMELKD